MAKKKLPSREVSTYGKCPVCRRDPEWCPHSYAEMDDRIFEDYVRAVVRDELDRQSRA